MERQRQKRKNKKRKVERTTLAGVDARLFVKTEGPEDALIAVNVSVPLEYVNGSLHNQEMEISMSYSEESGIRGSSKFNKIIQKILETFPGSRIISKEESEKLNPSLYKPEELLSVKIAPARRGAGRATASAGKRGQAGASYSLFDLLCFKGGI